MEKGTILIVDDNKGVLASLELLLETEFSEIKTAGNPNQMVQFLKLIRRCKLVFLIKFVHCHKIPV